jgi:predicted N-acyltransferase
VTDDDNMRYHVHPGDEVFERFARTGVMEPYTQYCGDPDHLGRSPFRPVEGDPVSVRESMSDQEVLASLRASIDSARARTTGKQAAWVTVPTELLTRALDLVADAGEVRA